MLILLLLIHRQSNVAIKVACTVLASIAGAFMAGSNELALVYMMTTLLFILIVSWIKKSKDRYYLFTIFSFCLLVSLFVVLAPGNYARMEMHAVARQPVWSVLYAGALTLVSLYRWGGLLILASLVYVLVFGAQIREAYQQSRLFKVPLSLLFLYIIGTLFLMHFVFTWATGERPTPRVENVIYFFLLLSWFYTLQVLIIQRPSWLLIQQAPFLVKGGILLLFLLSVLDIQNNVSTAYLDLLSGKAAKYNSALQDRAAYLHESKCYKCIVPALPTVPTSLHLLDIEPIGETEHKWVNEAYFNKKSIILAAPNPPVKDNVKTLVDLGKQWRRNTAE
ncbi:DUF6056 family protein [Pontibacter rugosus]